MKKTIIILVLSIALLYQVLGPAKMEELKEAVTGLPVIAEEMLAGEYEFSAPSVAVEAEENNAENLLPDIYIRLSF
ncbi:MAG: hypothetical protein K6G83_10625 [Lachnospiraceae bacterium]|nr:hypothetical protein [Lachnospiraceae bacterium]